MSSWQFSFTTLPNYCLYSDFNLRSRSSPKMSAPASLFICQWCLPGVSWEVDLFNRFDLFVFQNISTESMFHSQTLDKAISRSSFVENTLMAHFTKDKIPWRFTYVSGPPILANTKLWTMPIFTHCTTVKKPLMHRPSNRDKMLHTA